MDHVAAAVSETWSLHLVWAVVVFSGRLAAGLEALAFGVHTPAVVETVVV